MKKSLLSVVLCLAVLLASISTMLVMPTSAANGVDYLAGTAGGNAEGLDFTHADGVLTFNATAAGQEVALVVDTPANLNDYPFAEIAISSTGKFDLCFNDANNNKWMAGAGDFCYHFGEGLNPANPLPAGDYDVKIDLTGAYTWDGSALPANAEVVQIIVIAKEACTITLTKAQITDGVEDVVLYPENDFDALSGNWNTSANLVNNNVDAWIPTAADASGNSDIIVTYDEANAQMQFGNTNAGWPSASIEVNKTVDYATAALDVDLSVLAGAKTTLYVFFGNATPTDFDGEGKAYGTILSENAVGNYAGTVLISDILDANSDVIAEDGTVNVSYVKVYGTSDAVMNPAVLVNTLELYYFDEALVPTTTEAVETTTTEATTTTTVDNSYLTYTLETVEKVVGETIPAGTEIAFNVSVSATDDVNSGKIDISYADDLFEYVSGEFKGVFNTFMMKVVNPDVPAVDGVKTIQASVMALTANAAEEGEVVFTLTLKTKADISTDTAVELSYVKVGSNAGALAGVTLEAGAVNGGIKFVEPVTTTTAAETTTTAGETTTTDAETTTTAGETTTTAAGETTTTVAGETTTAAGETTTTAAPTAPTTKPGAPSTGDVSDAMLYIVIAGIAAAAVVLSTVMMKKKAR